MAKGGEGGDAMGGAIFIRQGGTLRIIESAISNSDAFRWRGWMTGYGLGGNASSDGNATGIDFGLGGTTLGMEKLRCKSPAMVRKEIYTHMISHDLIRDLVVRTALRHDTSPKNLSHTAAVQSFNAFSEKLQGSSNRIEQPYPTMKRPRHASRGSAA